MLSRIDEYLLFVSQHFRRRRVYIAYLFDLVAEKLKPHRIRFIRGPKLHNITADPEQPACKLNIVTCILNIGKPSQKFVTVYLVANANADNAGLVIFRRAKPEYARNTRYDYSVLAAHKARRR